MSDHTIELARRLAELGEKEGAQKAYFLVLQQADGSGPELEMEAASYLFFRGRLSGRIHHLCISLQPGVLPGRVDGPDDAGLLSAQCGGAAEAV